MGSSQKRKPQKSGALAEKPYPWIRTFIISQRGKECPNGHAIIAYNWKNIPNQSVFEYIWKEFKGRLWEYIASICKIALIIFKPFSITNMVWHSYFCLQAHCTLHELLKMHHLKSEPLSGQIIHELLNFILWEWSYQATLFWLSYHSVSINHGCEGMQLVSTTNAISL